LRFLAIIARAIGKGAQILASQDPVRMLVTGAAGGVWRT
jgi:hypothetical protein